MLLRSHLTKLCGKPVLKTRYRLVAVLGPAAKETDAAADGGKSLEVDVDVGEEGRDLSWWGLQEGDTIRVVES